MNSGEHVVITGNVSCQVVYFRHSGSDEKAHANQQVHIVSMVTILLKNILKGADCKVACCFKSMSSQTYVYITYLVSLGVELCS